MDGEYGSRKLKFKLTFSCFIFKASNLPLTTNFKLTKKKDNRKSTLSQTSPGSNVSAVQGY